MTDGFSCYILCKFDLNLGINISWFVFRVCVDLLNLGFVFIDFDGIVETTGIGSGQIFVHDKITGQDRVSFTSQLDIANNNL